MNIRFTQTLLTLLVASILILPACQKDDKKRDKTEDTEEVVTVDTIDTQLVKDIKSVKEMFYSMPSPLEVAMILKQAGKDYNPELLNPVDKTSEYVSTKNMALNLGIYATDLSYASLYDQTQTTIDYINASKKMAEGLGILNAIDQNTIERLEANVNNRDVILDIISETILNSSSFFQENDRQAVSTIILIGGWVEGLYIATNLIEDNPSQDDIENNELISRVADQKLAINTIMKLIEKNEDDENLKAVKEEISKLKSIYDEIKITSSKVVPVKDTVNQVTTLNSETEISMTPDIYNKLKQQVDVIRNQFTL
ncbi:MAG: hypothetical protein ACLFNJ_04340 [Bacteroidales bacterium]